MGLKVIELGLVLSLVAVVLSVAKAQSAGCSNTVTSLSPCLNYITGNTSNPSSSCCSQLSNVVQTSPQCLCSVINGGGAPLGGITINQTLALSLPGACKVRTPAISQCNAANAPRSSATPPVESPEDSSSNGTPEPAITPSASEIPSGADGGSKTVPLIDGGSSINGSDVIKTPLNYVLFFLFLLSCASTFSNF